MRVAQAVTAWIGVGFVGCMAASAAVAANLPDWLERAVARPSPAWSEGAKAVILHDEEIITIPRSGRTRVVERLVVRTLSPEGAEYAAYSVGYYRRTTEVKELRGWVVKPSGVVVNLGRRDAIDVSTAKDLTLYSDQRVLTIPKQEAPPGSVFAWECAREEEPLFAQWNWYFDSELPSLLSRVEINLPPGSEPVARAYGGDSVVVSARDGVWSWERRDIRPLPDEALSSRLWSGRSGMRIDVRTGQHLASAGTSFESWGDVARWLDGMAPLSGERDPALVARVADLTAAKTDTLERLRALSRDVQQLNYISVELGLGKGGGYRPHPAPDVMRLGYGDCKDRANLLRAMITAAGHRAWLVPAYLGIRDFVDEGWPSPQQFNHCIVAMCVPRGTTLSSVVDHPTLGPLLIFDPTNQWTFFGDLPMELQGSLGLLQVPERGGLLRLPIAPPDSNKLARTIEARLDPRGQLTARLSERSLGQRAAVERAIRQYFGDRYRETVERRMAGRARSIEVSGYACSDDSVSGVFDLAVDFVAPGFARIAQDRLLSFVPAIVGDRDEPLPRDSVRTWPVELVGNCEVDTVAVELPAGFVVDEIPGSIHDHRDFGSLDVDWRVEGGRLVYTRTWVVKPVTLPPARYGEVRDLFAAMQAAARAPVVLLRR